MTEPSLSGCWVGCRKLVRTSQKEEAEEILMTFYGLFRIERGKRLFIMLEHVTCKFNSLSLVFALWMECESTITREGNVLILYCNYSIHGCESVELNCCGWILWSKEMTSPSRGMVNAIKSKSIGQIFQSKLLEVKPKWILRAIKKWTECLHCPSRLQFATLSLDHFRSRLTSRDLLS